MFVIPTLTTGGAERVVSILATALSECGQSVYVVKYYGSDNEYPVGDSVIQINMFGSDRSAYEDMSYIKKVTTLRSTIKKVQPDYVIPFLFQVALCTDFAVKGLKVDVFQSMRIDPAMSPKSRILRLIRDHLVYKSKCTFVQNEKQRLYFKPKARRKINIIYNPVSKEMFSIKPRYSNEKYTICSAGRLEKQKNIRLLIDSFEAVFAENEGVILNIYGEGSQKSDLEDYISTKQAASRILLKGRSNDIVQVFENSDLFVLSSDFEGMPNALIEAMACGLPCISTDCPTGPAELINDKQNGILVPVRDVEALANALNEMYMNQSSAKDMGIMAQKTIESKCNSELIARQMIQICESIK